MKTLQPSRAKGSTLLEFLLASAVLGATLTAGYQWMQRSQEDTTLGIAAQHHKIVLEAASEYVRENQSSIVAGATATTPYKITVPMLVAAGKLPSGFKAINNFGQTQCVLVLEPTASSLAMLVVSEGGTDMTDFQLARAVDEIGANGGGIYSTATSTSTGSDGGWSISASTTPKLSDFLSANCSGTTADAGHFASSNFYSSSTLATNYLHRSNDPGRTDQTKMTDPLGLPVKTASGACDGVNEKGRIAVDSNDNILLCQNNGGWKWDNVGDGAWKDPVSSYASLPASGNSTGDVRVSTDNGRGYTWTGTAWKPLAIDQSGNFTVPNVLDVNGSKIQGDGGSNTWIKQSGTLRITNAAGSAYTDLAANDVTASGRTNTGELQLNTTNTEGTACSSNGLVSKDSSGSILYCGGLIWKKSATASSQAVYNTSDWIQNSGNNWYYNGTTHSGCTCGTSQLTTTNYCTFNSFQSGGNNSSSCDYWVSLKPMGYLVK